MPYLSIVFKIYASYGGIDIQELEYIISVRF